MQPDIKYQADIAHALKLRIQIYMKTKYIRLSFKKQKQKQEQSSEKKGFTNFHKIYTRPKNMLGITYIMICFSDWKT